MERSIQVLHPTTTAPREPPRTGLVSNWEATTDRASGTIDRRWRKGARPTLDLPGSVRHADCRCTPGQAAQCLSPKSLIHSKTLGPQRLASRVKPGRSSWNARSRFCERREYAWPFERGPAGCDWLAFPTYASMARRRRPIPPGERHRYWSDSSRIIGVHAASAYVRFTLEALRPKTTGEATIQAATVVDEKVEVRVHKYRENVVRR